MIPKPLESVQQYEQYTGKQLVDAHPHSPFRTSRKVHLLMIADPCEQ